jgi:hypothetical protein
MGMTLKKSNSCIGGRVHCLLAQKSSLKCEEHAHCFFDIQGVVHCESVPQG